MFWLGKCPECCLHFRCRPRGETGCSHLAFVRLALLGTGIVLLLLNQREKQTSIRLAESAEMGSSKRPRLCLGSLYRLSSIFQDLLAGLLGRGCPQPLLLTPIYHLSFVHLALLGPSMVLPLLAQNEDADLDSLCKIGFPQRSHTPICIVKACVIIEAMCRCSRVQWGRQEGSFGCYWAGNPWHLQQSSPRQGWQPG